MFQTKILYPVDLEIVNIIHRVIALVLRYGPFMEFSLIDHYKGDSRFDFILSNVSLLNKSSDNIYYRWKLLSLANTNNSLDNWSTDPVMIQGQIYYPPSIPFDESISDSSEFESDDESDEGSGFLSTQKRSLYEKMIRNLDDTTFSIGQVTLFCIMHSKSCQAVLDILFSALASIHSSNEVKITRLHLLSDLLYNSACEYPDAWKYKIYIQKKLLGLFTEFGALCSLITVKNDSKSSDCFRKVIVDILFTWEIWDIYSTLFINQLRDAILMPPSGSQDTHANTLMDVKLNAINSVCDDKGIESIIDKVDSTELLTKFRPIKTIDHESKKIKITDVKLPSLSFSIKKSKAPHKFQDIKTKLKPRNTSSIADSQVNSGLGIEVSTSIQAISEDKLRVLPQYPIKILIDMKSHSQVPTHPISPSQDYRDVVDCNLNEQILDFDEDFDGEAMNV